MHWILIVLTISKGNVSMQEFDSLNACKFASKIVYELESKHGYTAGGAYCVPKGDIK